MNVGQEGRARAFLSKRVEQGHTRDVIKVFEVRAELVASLRSTAVPEQLARQFPDAPIRVDMATPDQFGLRPEQFPDLLRSIVQGTGRTL